MDVSRREVIKTTLAAGAAALLGGQTLAQPVPPADPTAAAPDAADFTFVHVTDMHVTTRRQGDRGYKACLRSIAALRPRPAFLLAGGDLAFDGLYTPKADFARQVELYRRLTAECGIPCYHCLGNHDVLGWSSRRKVALDDPDLGKRFIMDRLGMQRSYYSFDHAGWHFVVLDSIYPKRFDHGPGYEPRIGPEQLEWLRYDLGAAGERPKVLVTHIAAFCNMGQINADPGYKAMDGHMVLWDTRELRTILERHRVKALLQGHSHRIEDYRFNGVWYVTSAAASGAWWAGNWVGSPPGYTVFHCRGQTLTWQHVSFAWEPRLEPEDELERRRIAEQQAFERRQRELLAQERAGRRP